MLEFLVIPDWNCFKIVWTHLVTQLRRFADFKCDQVIFNPWASRFSMSLSALSRRSSGPLWQFAGKKAPTLSWTSLFSKTSLLLTHFRFDRPRSTRYTYQAKERAYNIAPGWSLDILQFLEYWYGFTARLTDQTKLVYRRKVQTKTQVCYYQANPLCGVIWR